MSDAPRPALRLDKFLWHARFFKTRSQAAAFVAKGRLRLDGMPTARAHQPVRVGCVLTFPLGPRIRIVRVLALGERRGPAAEARTLYEDLSDEPGNAQRAAKGPDSCRE